MPAENITVEALWKKNNYTITYYNDTTVHNVSKFEYNDTVTVPAEPTKEGHTFKGWNETLPEKMPAENITVKALWERIPEPAAGESQLIIQSKPAWQVVFYPNGGEGSMESEIFVEGEKEALPKNPFTREGYTFKGWSLTPDGEVLYTDEEIVLINKTTRLYAVWEAPAADDTPEVPNGPAIPLLIAGILIGLLIIIIVIKRRKSDEEETE
jgi:hypothetical protein